MEMCYDGTLVMPSSYAVMDVEEMMYLEAGGTVSITFTKDFLRDCITAGCCLAGGIIGLLIGGGASGGTAAAIASLAGGAIGWIIGGAIARGTVKENKTLSVWVPFVPSKSYTIW